MSIQTWLQDLIKAAVEEAMKDVQDEILAEIQTMEKNLIAQVALLPGLLGSQIQNVAVDAGALAGKVVSAVNGQLAGFPQQIISGVLQGIPNILNPFRGDH
jgi:hypothetical protein